MPSKRRRIAITSRRRKITEDRIDSPSQFLHFRTSYERSVQKSDSDIRTIPDQTFGKVYSTQIVSHSQTTTTENRPSPYASSMIESEIIIASLQKPKRKKATKKKERK